MINYNISEATVSCLQVRNKLDNCKYAIKKIYFRDTNIFVWVKVKLGFPFYLCYFAGFKKENV